MFGHILKGTQGCAEYGEPLLLAGEGVVADPHIGAEGIQVWQGDAGCIPNSDFATVELDAGVCAVYCTDSVALNHGIDVIQLGQ